MGCVFCDIAQGNTNSDIVYQDEQVVAFRDIKPQAPVHILIIPRQHISTPVEFSEDTAGIAGHMVVVAGKVATQEGIEDGYRLVMNNGSKGGQSVFHVHLHVLGGRRMQWPPG